MIKITEEHGLIPVPVDIDPYTMMPTLDAIKAATTDKSVACLFAYIWGVTYDVSPFANYLHSHNIEMIEDAA
jgi:perosamine synthetase